MQRQSEAILRYNAESDDVGKHMLRDKKNVMSALVESMFSGTKERTLVRKKHRLAGCFVNLAGETSRCQRDAILQDPRVMVVSFSGDSCWPSDVVRCMYDSAF